MKQTLRVDITTFFMTTMSATATIFQFRTFLKWIKKIEIRYGTNWNSGILSQQQMNLYPNLRKHEVLWKVSSATK